MSNLKTHTMRTYNYALLMYDAMLAEAKEEPAGNVAVYGYPAQPNEKVLIFRGTASNIGNGLGYTVSNTQRFMSLLKAMRSVTILKNGGPVHPSVYALHFRPTERQYQEFREHTRQANTYIIPSKYELLLRSIESLRDTMKLMTDQIDDLRGRINYLELMAQGKTPE